MVNVSQGLTFFGIAFTLAVLFGLLFSFPVMLLWNGALVPAVAGLSEIGWLQAWGIVILCAFLFKPSVNMSTK